MINLWTSTNPCEISGVLKVISFVNTLLSVVCFVVPMGLIIMIMLDIAKNVIANQEDMKKNFNIAMKRIIYCMCIFLVPSVVNLMASLVNDAVTNANVTTSGCVDNLNNIAYYEKLEKLKMEQEEKKQAETLAKRFAKSNANSTVKRKKISTESSGSGENGAPVSGQKYDLTDSQLRGLAMIAQREQGSPVGAAAEASLMANLFELKGSAYGTGGSGLYNYVANGGWFGQNAGSYMQNTSSLNPEVLSAVKEVLVLGKRTLPLYVDEHDCISCGAYGFDIISIVTNGTTITDANGLLNRSNYKKDSTVITNKYGATYTFYTFPTETSDPFGYTKASRDRFN